MDHSDVKGSLMRFGFIMTEAPCSGHISMTEAVTDVEA